MEPVPRPLVKTSLLRTLMAFEEAAVEDPLEWQHGAWLQGKHLPAVLTKMKANTDYRQDFYDNCYGLSYAEIGIILKVGKVGEWGVFLPEECVWRLREAALSAFRAKHLATGAFHFITFEQVMKRDLVRYLDVTALLFLIEERIINYSALSDSDWVFRLDGKWQLKIEDWRKASLAWEALTPATLWSIHSRSLSIHTFLEIICYPPVHPNLPDALKRLVWVRQIERYFRRVGGGKEEGVIPAVRWAAKKMEERTLKLCSEEGLVFAWLGGCIEARKRDGARRAIPIHDLIAEMIRLIGANQDLSTRFGRRWHLRLLELGASLCTDQNSYARFLQEQLIRLASPNCSSEEVEGLLWAGMEAGGAVWAAVRRAFAGRKEIGWTIAMMTLQTKPELPPAVPETRSRSSHSSDCVIQ